MASTTKTDDYIHIGEPDCSCVLCAAPSPRDIGYFVALAVRGSDFDPNNGKLKKALEQFADEALKREAASPDFEWGVLLNGSVVPCPTEALARELADWASDARVISRPRGHWRPEPRAW